MLGMLKGISWKDSLQAKHWYLSGDHLTVWDLLPWGAIRGFGRYFFCPIVLNKQISRYPSGLGIEMVSAWCLIVTQFSLTVVPSGLWSWRGGAPLQPKQLQHQPSPKMSLLTAEIYPECTHCLTHLFVFLKLSQWKYTCVIWHASMMNHC